MLIQHKTTGQFYTAETFNILDVSANTMSMAVVVDENFDLELAITRTFQKVRGDHFQLVKTVEDRERTYRLLESSGGMIESESYQVKDRKMTVVKTLKWNGRRFVEVN